MQDNTEQARDRALNLMPRKNDDGTTTLQVSPYFSNPDVNPYDEFDWEYRTAEIKNHGTGEVLFRQERVHFPKHFSQNATNIVASKYFYGDKDKPNGSPAEGNREYSLGQLINRVVLSITAAGIEQGLLDNGDAEVFERELTWLLVNQYGAFNSPVWFNVGLGQVYGIRDDKKDVYGHIVEDGDWHIGPVDPYERPQASACFIIGLEDSIEGIWDLMAEWARLFKYGSGVGSDWSVLRSTKDKLSGGRQPSGPVSFMRVQDFTGGTIQSGRGGDCTALHIDEEFTAETGSLSTAIPDVWPYSRRVQ